MVRFRSISSSQRCTQAETNGCAIHLAARHEEVLLELVALDAVRIQRIDLAARLQFIHPQRFEINQQPAPFREPFILLIAPASLSQRWTVRGRTSCFIASTARFLNRHDGAAPPSRRRFPPSNAARRWQASQQINIIARNAAMPHRPPMQVGRLAKNGVCRRLMRVQEGMHTQIGVLFVRNKRQTDLFRLEAFVAIKRNRSRTHGRNAAFHIARRVRK